MSRPRGVLCFQLAPDTGNYVPVGGYRFALRLAAPGDLNEVRWLVDQATEWLTRSKGTDQWAKPWPTREARDRRLLAGIRHGRTWIVWDDDVPVATITVAARSEHTVWSRLDPGCDPSDPAVYAHRLITARDYAGRGLGADLIDWAGLRGQRLHGAKWIRIDVWTSNAALHDYYRETGFTRCGTCADPSYPSGALFQKPVSAITEAHFPQFNEHPAVLEPAAHFARAAC
jgi:GNAT superfamily N-acetyltransferase